jgi:hypothetical protein
VDRDYLLMLMEYILSQQTSGNQANPGGDRPYDDYGLQGTIGGLGAFDSTQRFLQPQDTIGGMTQDPTAHDTSASATGAPRPMNLPPGLPHPYWAYPPEQGWEDVPISGFLEPDPPNPPPMPAAPPPGPDRPRLYEDWTMEGPFDGPPYSGGPRPIQSLAPEQKGRAAAPKTLPPQASRQAIASTGRTYRSASQPAQAVRAAQAIVNHFASVPVRSFGAPATRVLNTSTRKLR